VVKQSYCKGNLETGNCRVLYVADLLISLPGFVVVWDFCHSHTPTKVINGYITCHKPADCLVWTN